MSHAAPEPKNGKPGPEEGYGLPEWFALKGPPPFWLSGNWTIILAVAGALLVLLNMLTQQKFLSLEQGEWVNAAVAWFTAFVLFLQTKQGKVREIAKWRARVREEHQKEK